MIFLKCKADCATALHNQFQKGLLLSSWLTCHITLWADPAPATQTSLQFPEALCSLAFEQATHLSGMNRFCFLLGEACMLQNILRVLKVTFFYNLPPQEGLDMSSSEAVNCQKNKKQKTETVMELPFASFLSFKLYKWLQVPGLSTIYNILLSSLPPLPSPDQMNLFVPSYAQISPTLRYHTYLALCLDVLLWAKS